MDGNGLFDRAMQKTQDEGHCPIPDQVFQSRFFRASFGTSFVKSQFQNNPTITQASMTEAGDSFSELTNRIFTLNKHENLIF